MQGVKRTRISFVGKKYFLALLTSRLENINSAQFQPYYLTLKWFTTIWQVKVTSLEKEVCNF